MEWQAVMSRLTRNLAESILEAFASLRIVQNRTWEQGFDGLGYEQRFIEEVHLWIRVDAPKRQQVWKPASLFLRRSGSSQNIGGCFQQVGAFVRVVIQSYKEAVVTKMNLRQSPAD